MESIYVVNLFPTLDSKLLELLRSLTPEQWKLKATPRWTVHDVAAHLLDGSNLRRLSLGRDNYWGEPFHGSSYQDLVDFLNGLNADWVKAFRRISPRILIQLLETSGKEVAEHFRSLDPHAPAPFPVSWAGESESENWFDIARDYTEKWHHQQQIREAVGQDGIMSRELYFPVLDTFMRALPHSYRDVLASSGAGLAVHVTGEAGGSWFLTRRRENWELSRDCRGEVSAEISMPQSIAWKLFTKGLSEEAASQHLQLSGEKTLTDPILHVTAIMG
ncbi:MAG TPA: maleylpyruvate isomerase family mycothiol-dependent enzyme [Terriglobales bacterium]|nr:maleylpyruvate isomerase family mycothiol-dependent enzyme [Terriglobales bacterium]